MLPLRTGGGEERDPSTCCFVLLVIIEYILFQSLTPLSALAKVRWPPSSRGLGHRPFTAATRVRIPLGVRSDRLCENFTIKALWRSWLARRPVTAEVAGSSPVRVAEEISRHTIIVCRDISSLFGLGVLTRFRFSGPGLLG